MSELEGSPEGHEEKGQNFETADALAEAIEGKEEEIRNRKHAVEEARYEARWKDNPLPEMPPFEYPFVRVWGKLLAKKPSTIRPDKYYWEIEDAPDDPSAYFDTRPFQTHREANPAHSRIALTPILPKSENPEDYRGNIPGVRFGPNPKQEEDIHNWRLEVITRQIDKK